MAHFKYKAEIWSLEGKVQILCGPGSSSEYFPRVFVALLLVLPFPPRHVQTEMSAV